MIRLGQIKLKIQDEQLTEQQEREYLHSKCAHLLHVPHEDIKEIIIKKKSIDARKKPELFWIYTVDCRLTQDTKKLADGIATPRELAVLKKIKDANITIAKDITYDFPVVDSNVVSQCMDDTKQKRPVMIGAGPAGLFCGYILALHGFRPVILERGADVDTRSKDVEDFWNGGTLNPESNVQFGEGGAGTFSDGKLNTLVKDKSGRNKKVLEIFVKEGAPEKILYESKPHIGTDILKTVVKNMRNTILKNGGEVRFQSKVTDLLIEDNVLKGVVINHHETLCSSFFVLAIGHSARDTFEMLYEKGIPMEQKSFAVGYRVEHAQDKIDCSQYGSANVGKLPAAPYKLTAQSKNGRGVYSFCMCPGGYVVNASSEPERLAINGMSYSKRDSHNANSAIIVAVTPEDFSSDHPLAGIAFQRNLEEAAFQAGQGNIPVQYLKDYKENISSVEDLSKLQPCQKGMYKYTNLRGILPKPCEEAFLDGMNRFGQIIKGYDADDTLLSGIESRTSSPVRISRDETQQSAVRNLYPCGEGAGYAGGIMSAAMDGLRIAEEIALQFS